VSTHCFASASQAWPVAQDIDASCSPCIPHPSARANGAERTKANSDAVIVFIAFSLLFWLLDVFWTAALARHTMSQPKQKRLSHYKHSPKASNLCRKIAVQAIRCEFSSVWQRQFNLTLSSVLLARPGLRFPPPYRKHHPNQSCNSCTHDQALAKRELKNNKGNAHGHNAKQCGYGNDSRRLRCSIFHFKLQQSHPIGSENSI